MNTYPVQGHTPSATVQPYPQTPNQVYEGPNSDCWTAKNACQPTIETLPPNICPPGNCATPGAVPAGGQYPMSPPPQQYPYPQQYNQPAPQGYYPPQYPQYANPPPPQGGVYAENPQQIVPSGKKIGSPMPATPKATIQQQQTQKAALATNIGHKLANMGNTFTGNTIGNMLRKNNAITTRLVTFSHTSTMAENFQTPPEIKHCNNDIFKKTPANLDPEQQRRRECVKVGNLAKSIVLHMKIVEYTNTWPFPIGLNISGVLGREFSNHGDRYSCVLLHTESAIAVNQFIHVMQLNISPQAFSQWVGLDPEHLMKDCKPYKEMYNVPKTNVIYLLALQNLNLIEEKQLPLPKKDEMSEECVWISSSVVNAILTELKNNIFQFFEYNNLNSQHFGITYHRADISKNHEMGWLAEDGALKKFSSYNDCTFKYTSNNPYSVSVKLEISYVITNEI